MVKDKTVKKKKRFDLKSLIFGGEKETTVPGSRFPNGTQAMVPVVDIRNGVVITEDGRYMLYGDNTPLNLLERIKPE